MVTVKNARVTLQDWQFKDGTKVPKGTHIFTNQIAYQMATFEDPNTFDPWRMHKLRATEGEGTKHQFVMTSDRNLHFGHGKHACPGRFFAANEVKTLLSLFLMRYDMRIRNLSVEQVQQGIRYANSRRPTPNAIVEFKDRTELIPEDLKTCFL